MQLGEQQASANKAVALSVVPVMANGGINNSRKNSNPRPREKIRRDLSNRLYTQIRPQPVAGAINARGLITGENPAT